VSSSYLHILDFYNGATRLRMPDLVRQVAMRLGVLYVVHIVLIDEMKRES
jgi:hypothetical protein